VTDPGRIDDTVASLVREKIRVSIIGFSASMRICQHICTETLGTYGITLNEHHYKELLFSHTQPPPRVEKSLNMVQMGFPSSVLFKSNTYCAWYVCLTQPLPNRQDRLHVPELLLNSMHSPYGLPHMYYISGFLGISCAVISSPFPGTRLYRHHIWHLHSLQP
jgi:Ssl1-like